MRREARERGRRTIAPSCPAPQKKYVTRDRRSRRNATRGGEIVAEAAKLWGNRVAMSPEMSLRPLGKRVQRSNDSCLHWRWVGWPDARIARRQAGRIGDNRHRVG